MLPLSLKVAVADGALSDQEKLVIRHYYINRWGYDSDFIDRMIIEYLAHIDQIDFAIVADSFNLYCKDSPDCDPKAISDGFISHLREVTMDDGGLRPLETKAMDELLSLLQEAESPGYVNQTLGNVKQGVSEFPGNTIAAVGAGTEAGRGLIGRIIKWVKSKPNPKS